MSTPESIRAKNDMYLAVLDVFIRLITKNDIVFDIKPHTIKNGNIIVFNTLDAESE
jgi:hypothetical protein